MDFLGFIKYIGVALIFCAVYLLGLQTTGSLFLRGRRLWEQSSGILSESRRLIFGKNADVKYSRVRHSELWGGAAGLMAGASLSPMPLSSPLTWLLALLACLAGLLAPQGLNSIRLRRRRQRLEQQFPDALELIGNSLRAGLSLAQALEVAAKETPQPLADEFGAVLRDYRLGLPAEDALEKMHQRWPHRDLELFVVAAIVSQRTGSNLAETTGKMVATIRERFRLRRRIASLTAQGKLSGWVVGLLPLALLLALTFLDPALMSGFFQHPLGWALLSGGLLLELIGMFFIRKIVAIEA